MYLTKSCSVLRRLKINKCISNIVGQNVIFRGNKNSASSIEETEPQPSTLDKEKKVMKGPFIKNVFAGVFNSDIFEYPEYPTIELVNTVNELTYPLQEYISSADFSKIDETGVIPEDVTKILKEFKLFGVQTPLSLGGLDYDCKSCARYYESVGSELNLTASLAAHGRTLNALLIYGTDLQKQRLVNKLSSGEINIGFCLVEKPNILDITEIDTVALPGKDNDWVLNGKKIWVINGNNADYFMVFAKTWHGTIDHSNSNSLSVFLVDKNSPGLKFSSDTTEQLGTKGVGLCDVTFKDVIVTKESVIGEIGSGSDIAINCLNSVWLNSSAGAVGYLKKLLNSVIDYAIHTKISGKSLYTQEYFQKHLGAIAADIYALESMVYLTAGIKDEYDEPDTSLEEAIVKIYSTEKTVEIVDLCANLVGGTAYIKGSQIERSIRDSRSYLLHDIIPLNVTKMYLATQGLHHAGKTLQTEIKKARNPAHFPAFAFKRLFKPDKVLDDEYKVPEQLRLNIHPSLSGDADKLESCVLRVEFIIKNLFQRWGIEIVDRHMDLLRLADCMVSIYGMTAVLGRASRSYCIGLTNSNHELVASNAICAYHFRKVKDTVNLINDGPITTLDSQFTYIGKELASQKGYMYEHPLARNY